MTQYPNSMKQKSLGVLLIAGGLFGLEKMLGINPQECGLAKYMDYGAKATFMTGLAGCGFNFLESIRTETKREN